MFTMRRALLLAVAAATACVSAGLLAEAGPAAAPPAVRPFKPVQPLEVMMEGQEKLYAMIKDGILDKKWSDAEKAAWILAEIANCNQYQKPDPQYQEFAGQMSSQCVVLARFLAQKKEKEARDQFTQVGQTCQACHDKFRPRP